MRPGGRKVQTHILHYNTTLHYTTLQYTIAEL